MKAKQKTAVILHSGGLDSSVCILLALEKGRKVISLGIDYAQRQKVEMRYAQRLCRRLRIERRVVSARWDKPNLNIPLDRTIGEMRKSVSPAFLPGRNILFLALGVTEAASIKANELWIGVNSRDFSGYPDCRPEFIHAFQTAILKGIPGGPKIIAPLQYLDKIEIAAEAQRLGLKLGDTWSCYRPKRSGRSFQPCGRCDACILHSYAWNGIHRKKSQTV